MWKSALFRFFIDDWQVLFVRPKTARHLHVKALRYYYYYSRTVAAVCLLSGAWQYPLS